MLCHDYSDSRSDLASLLCSLCKSVAKESHISATLEKKIKVIHRMGDGGTRPKACGSMKLPLPSLSTIMKN
jgi:hypothetical protein